MKFLTARECDVWRQTYNIASRSHLDSTSTAAIRSEFRIPSDAGERIALCRLIWNQLDSIERLLIVTGWSVWPSGEHLPLFNSLRAVCGERRSLSEAPGQLFYPKDDGLSFLLVGVLFLWDLEVYDQSGTAIAFSHDEVGVASLGAHSSQTMREELDQMGILIK